MTRTGPLTAAEYRTAAARAMTEAQLLAAVRRLATALGWRTYHTHDSRRSPAGFPDLTLVRRGRLVFAELKTERGKTTGEQDAWLADLADVELRADNVRAYVWRPRDLLDGTIAAVLQGDTPTTPGLALPPRT